jgi:hypothetical protein
MNFKIVNPSTNRSGGVLMFWKREITIQQIFSHPNYLDVKVMLRLWRGRIKSGD